MHHKILLATVFLAIAGNSYAQSYKILDHAAFYKAHDVETIRIERIIYNAQIPVDTSLHALVTCDDQGRPIHFTSHFAGGRKYAEEFFQYDENGRLFSIHCVGRPTQGDTVAYELSFDEKHRLQSRILPKSDDSKRMEFFERCKDGFITLCTVQTQRAGAIHHDQVLKFDSKEVEDSRNGESNLTYLFDMDGLLLVKNIYTDQGELREAYHYRYNEQPLADATP